MTLRMDTSGHWYDDEEEQERVEEYKRFDEFLEISNIMEFASKFIKKTDENVYELGTPEGFKYMGGPCRYYKSLCDKVIKRKYEIGETDIELDIDDLHMVRTMDCLPEDFCYSSHTHTGAYTRLANPFFSGHFVRGYGKDDEFRIVMPTYRDTVHFALNGLASDTFRSTSFTDRSFVVIEPLLNHFDKLVNLNPIDTFIDVKEDDEPIGNNAVFIIEKNEYESLPDEKKNDLKKYKVIIFDYQQLFGELDDRYQGPPPLQIVTDYVLCSMGILPQHSVAQSVLHPEDFQEYQRVEGVFTSRILDDSAYLKKFTDLIERLNIERFGVSYYNLPPEIAELRKFNQLGYFHVDMPQWKEEVENNRMLFKDGFKRYMDFLNERIGFPEEVLQYAYNDYDHYIDVLLLCSSWGLFAALPDDKWKPYTSIEEIKELTREFNELEKDRLKRIALQHRMMKDIGEEEKADTDIVLHTK